MTVREVAPPLRTLVRGLVDYAGLFPPAALPMAEAVANYASYHRSADAWALGRFVVTAARLAEFEAAARDLAPAAGEAPWHLSLLVAQPQDGAACTACNARWNGRIVIDVIEGKASTPGEVDALVAAMPEGPTLFVELPLDDRLGPCLTRVKATGALAKIRTGGVVAEAFPAAAQVVGFLRGCHDAGVDFKATAGLHHPVRGPYRLTYAPDAPVGTMYGYLNVLLAAAAIRAGGSDADATRLLLAEDPDTLALDGNVVTWAGVHVPVTADVRTFMRGVGSCSFREPVDELLALPIG